MRDDVVRELIGISVGKHINPNSQESRVAPRQTASRPTAEISNYFPSQEFLITLLRHPKHDPFVMGIRKRPIVNFQSASPKCQLRIILLAKVFYEHAADRTLCRTERFL